MPNIKKKNLIWITFNAFIDTDIYVVKELSKYYSIEWYIIRSENDKIEYISSINEIKETTDIKIKFDVCGRRLRSLECLRFYNAFFKNIKKKKDSIIFTSMAGAPYFIPFLALKTDIKKVIVAIHNVHVPKGGNNYNFFKFYNKLTISKFKNFVTYSKSQYNDLRELTDNKKNILYVPFMLKDYGKATKERNNTVITFLNFGNIRDYKRIDVLIESAQKAYELTQKRFKVIIAGQCDNWDKYQKLIKYDFLFDIRIGRVENEEIPNLFNEADYFVAPYQDIAQSGSSIVALNYSKPTIASKLPAFEEYITNEETGYLIKPADIDSLTSVMQEIIESNLKGYNKMVQNLENNRDKFFSASSIVEKYRRYIDGLY